MIDLQKARREAAQRFEAIGMSYLPGGWTFAYRKSLTGCCYWQRKHIDGPKPVTRRSLYVWLHECGHAHLHGQKCRKPRHLKEYEAETWAHAKMREHGIPVPKASTKQAKLYVMHKIDKAIVRGGAKAIDADALKFAMGDKRMRLARKMQYQHLRRMREEIKRIEAAKKEKP